MKVLHLISGGDSGGAMTHVLLLLGQLNNGDEAALACLGDGPLARGAAERGLPCAVLSRRLSAAPGQAEALIRREGFALLHCHGSRANVIGAALKGRLGIPVISTVHSDHRLDYLGRPAARLIYGTMNALALRRMDALVCVSDPMAAVYRGRGFARVYPIYNGVDFSAPLTTVPRRERAAALGIPVSAEDILVGTAARMDPVKDLATLLRGFARCADPALKLILAGTGREEPRLRALAKRLGIADRVFFPGWVEDMDRFYAALDIFALTSRSETFPYALTDAARYGLAVIAAAVGGVPELVEDRVTGCLFPPGDADALARGLDRLAGDERLRARLGAALREKAENRFSLAAAAERQREIYRQVLAAFPARDK